MITDTTFLLNTKVTPSQHIIYIYIYNNDYNNTKTVRDTTNLETNFRSTVED